MTDARRTLLRRVWAGVRVVVLIALVAGLWQLIDWNQLATVISELSVTTVLGMLCCGTAARLFGVLRWRVLAGGLVENPPSVPRLFRLGLLAEFVNIWVPSFIGGEVVRIWGMREYGSTAAATWSVVIDRSMGLAGLVVAVAPIAFLIDSPTPYGLLALLAVAVGLGLAFALRPRLMRLGGWASALGGLDVRRVLLALLLSTASPWCLVVAYLLFFGTVHPISPQRVAAFVLLSRFGRAIPFQVFGVNSVEGTMWVLGRILDIPREVLALSLFTNVLDKLVHSMLGGSIELLSNGTEMLQRVMRAPPTGE